MTLRYNIQLSNGRQVSLDPAGYQHFLENASKTFVVTQHGEVINPSFVVGIFVDTEASRQEQLKKLSTLEAGVLDKNSLEKVRRYCETSQPSVAEVYTVNQILQTKKIMIK